MDSTHLLTSLTPAIMLFLVAMAVRFFPPSRTSNSIVFNAPEWWSRDEKTWASAYGFLSKRYLHYSIVLGVICGALLFFELTYGATIGYLLLVVFFVVAQFQVRQFMNASVK